MTCCRGIMHTVVQPLDESTEADVSCSTSGLALRFQPRKSEIAANDKILATRPPNILSCERSRIPFLASCNHIIASYRSHTLSFSGLRPPGSSSSTISIIVEGESSSLDKGKLREHPKIVYSHTKNFILIF